MGGSVLHEVKSVGAPMINFKASVLPDDAVEVGRVLDAWGVKGWLKILPHSAEPEALFSAKSWFLQAPDPKFRPGFNAFTGTAIMSIDEAKTHSDSVVAKINGLDDRNDAESLRGCRIFLPRSAFPQASKDEYYWVDLIGLNVVNLTIAAGIFGLPAIIAGILGAQAILAYLVCAALFLCGLPLVLRP